MALVIISLFLILFFAVDLSNATRARMLTQSTAKYATDSAMRVSLEEGTYRTRRVAGINEAEFKQRFEQELPRMAGTDAKYQTVYLETYPAIVEMRPYIPIQSWHKKFDSYNANNNDALYPNHRVVYIWDQHVILEQLQ